MTYTPGVSCNHPKLKMPEIHPRTPNKRNIIVRNPPSRVAVPRIRKSLVPRFHKVFWISEITTIREIECLTSGGSAGVSTISDLDNTFKAVILFDTLQACLRLAVDTSKSKLHDTQTFNISRHQLKGLQFKHREL